MAMLWNRKCGFVDKQGVSLDINYFYQDYKPDGLFK